MCAGGIGAVQVIDVFTLRVFQWMVILWQPGLEKVGEEMKQEMVWAGNSSPLHCLGFFNFDTDTVTSTP